MTDQDDSIGSADTPAPETTRRKAQRKRVIKAARLVLGGGLSTIDGTVRDVSATGARIRLPHPMRITGPVQVILSGGERVDAEVVRLKGLDLGLRFTSDRRPSVAPPPDEIEQIRTELEAPRMGAFLALLERIDATREPAVHGAAAEVRAACARLREAVEGRTSTF